MSIIPINKDKDNYFCATYTCIILKKNETDKIYEF